jgi:single-strand DNA-binding protein
MSTNHTTLVGNLTSDPEVKFAQGSGNAYLSFSIAVNHSKEEVSFFNVKAFKELAENITNSLAKGTRVIVIGYTKQESWEDKETGQKRSSVTFYADDVAPSLRWATAVVTKNEYKGGDSNSNSNENSSAPVRSQATLTGDEPF